MTYPLPAWQDSPSIATPLDAANLLLYNTAINGLSASLLALQPPLTITPVQTSNYSASANQFVLVDTTAGSVIVFPPIAPANGTVVGVKQVARGVPNNSVTVQLGGSDKFNIVTGGQTMTVQALNQAATFQYSSATSVWVLMSDDLPLSQITARAIAVTMALGPFGVSA